ncbi:putative sarcosine oxidase [Parasteatoda tepidariorum]|uniref:putative sarcosine oxidase n=1 Tax=Parasteatoda tepidariorum TaxID=114398 RepID=UPI00077FD562|nr:uncharacterized protein LOC107449057 [Parasteatoda tepidariorum]
MCIHGSAIEYDLCIVGAGMFGSAAARHASVNPTLKVCLIGPEEPTEEEFKNREIFGAHYDEGRIVHANETCEAYQTLNRESISRFREIEKLSDIKFYNPCGSMLIFDQHHYETWHLLDKNTPGCTQCVDLSSKDIFYRRFPFFKVKENASIFFDDMGSGYISPRNMVAAQKKVAKMQGCHIIDDVVEEVREPVNGLHEVITEHNICIRAKRILLCPGAFINLKKFYPNKPLKTSLRKETATFLSIPKEEAVRLSSMPTVITRNEGPKNQPDIIGSYILPPIKYPDDKHYLKIGHIGEIVNSELTTLDEVKKWYQSTGSEDTLSFFSRMLKDLLPGLKVEKIFNVPCVTADSPTGFPYIDRLTPTVTVAAIGNSRGAAMCEEVGRLAAHLSVTGKWDSKISKSLFEVIYE